MTEINGKLFEGIIKRLIVRLTVLVQALYFMQQAASSLQEIQEAIRYSVGLSFVCFLILLLLWLPDILSKN